MIEKSSSKPEVAARVKVSRARDTEWHAKKLEEGETRQVAKEGDASESPPENGDSKVTKRRAEKQQQDPEPEARSAAQAGGSSSSSSPPGVSAPGGASSGARKREAENHGDRNAPDEDDMNQDLVSWHQGVMEARRQRPEKRPAQEDPPTGGEIKQQRIGEGPMDIEDQYVGLMERLEEVERNTQHIATSEWHLPMITCEESIDLSYLENPRAKEIEETIACTNVGSLREQLGARLGQCMMAELCEGESSEKRCPAGSVPGGVSQEELGASIFDHGSQMGVTG